MKRSKLSESQFTKALKENESGNQLKTLAGVEDCIGTFYSWHKKYGGLELSHIKPLLELEAENQKLLPMYP